MARGKNMLSLMKFFRLHYKGRENIVSGISLSQILSHQDLFQPKGILKLFVEHGGQSQKKLYTPGPHHLPHSKRNTLNPDTSLADWRIDFFSTFLLYYIPHTLNLRRYSLRNSCTSNNRICGQRLCVCRVSLMCPSSSSGETDGQNPRILTVQETLCMYFVDCTRIWSL